MSPTDLVAASVDAVPHLLKLARATTRNRIANKCLFILSEIPNEPADANQWRRLSKRLNDAKRPLPLADLAPALAQLYPGLYDVNLYVYRAIRCTTIVDIRYYPKSALAPAYQAQIADCPPMLHVKVATPPWLALAQPIPKFDINWERQVTWTKLRMWWFRRTAFR